MCLFGTKWLWDWEGQKFPSTVTCVKQWLRETTWGSGEGMEGGRVFAQRARVKKTEKIKDGKSGSIANPVKAKQERQGVPDKILHQGIPMLPRDRSASLSWLSSAKVRGATLVLRGRSPPHVSGRMISHRVKSYLFWAVPGFKVWHEVSSIQSSSL